MGRSLFVESSGRIIELVALALRLLTGTLSGSPGVQE